MYHVINILLIKIHFKSTSNINMLIDQSRRFGLVLNVIIQLIRKATTKIILLLIQKLKLINVTLVGNVLNEKVTLLLTSNLFTLKSHNINVKFVIKYLLNVVVYLIMLKRFMIRFDLLFVLNVIKHLLKMVPLQFT